MRNLKRTFAAFLLAAPLMLAAQTSGEIKGKVLDLSGAALPGASVHVKYGDQIIGSATDLKGDYILKPLNSGSYNVHVSYMGYRDKMIAGVQVNPDQITVMDAIVLSMDVAMIDSVVEVVAWKTKLIDPEATSKISITPTMLKKNVAIKNPVQIVANMVPGVTKSRDGGLHFRGSRTSAISYYVDGVKQSDNFSPVPGTAIGNITVYTGGLPAKYGDVTGGVVVIETKSYFDLYNAWVAEEEMRRLKDL